MDSKGNISTSVANTFAADPENVSQRYGLHGRFLSKTFTAFSIHNPGLFCKPVNYRVYSFLFGFGDRRGTADSAGSGEYGSEQILGDVQTANTQ
jgi:hypothetical protein